MGHIQGTGNYSINEIPLKSEKIFHVFKDSYTYDYYTMVVTKAKVKIALSPRSMYTAYMLH